jgi:hypothetical protein
MLLIKLIAHTRKNTEIEQLNIKIASSSGEHQLFHFEKQFFSLISLSSI